jgi:hypothetical protein
MVFIPVPPSLVRRRSFIIAPTPLADDHAIFAWIPTRRGRGSPCPACGPPVATGRSMRLSARPTKTGITGDIRPRPGRTGMTGDLALIDIGLTSRLLPGGPNGRGIVLPTDGRPASGVGSPAGPAWPPYGRAADAPDTAGIARPTAGRQTGGSDARVGTPGGTLGLPAGSSGIRPSPFRVPARTGPRPAEEPDGPAGPGRPKSTVHDRREVDQTDSRFYKIRLTAPVASLMIRDTGQEAESVVH